MHYREMESYEILQRISDEVFDDLECRGLHHSCIEGSALLTSVLRRVGFVDAYPLTVGVTIFNKAHQDWVKAHGAPTDEASCRACDAAGSMTIVIGKGAEHMVSEDRWAGHLAVVVPAVFGDRHALLDLTIVQAHRPEWGIVLQPLCLRVRDQFVSGKDPGNFLVNGRLLRYTAYPDDHSYSDTGDLMAIARLEQAAAKILSRLG